jgi:hypothetical protein
MEAVSFSETSVNIYQTTRCSILDGSHLLSSHPYKIALGSHCYDTDLDTLFAAVTIVAFVIFFFSLLASSFVMWRKEHLWNFSVLQGVMAFQRSQIFSSAVAYSSPERSATHNIHLHLQHCKCYCSHKRNITKCESRRRRLVCFKADSTHDQRRNYLLLLPVRKVHSAPSPCHATYIGLVGQDHSQEADDLQSGRER